MISPVSTLANTSFLAVISPVIATLPVVDEISTLLLATRFPFTVIPSLVAVPNVTLISPALAVEFPVNVIFPLVVFNAIFPPSSLLRRRSPFTLLTKISLPAVIIFLFVISFAASRVTLLIALISELLVLILPVVDVISTSFPLIFPAVSIFPVADNPTLFVATNVELFVAILPVVVIVISFPAVKLASFATVISPVPLLSTISFSPVVVALLLITKFPVLLLIVIFPAFSVLSKVTPKPFASLLFTKISPVLFPKFIELNLLVSDPRFIPVLALAFTILLTILLFSSWFIFP